MNIDTLKHCADCKFSSEYFRGLLCHWVERNGVPKLPAYLQISGHGYAGLESSYPWMLDKKDLAEECGVFEKKEIEDVKTEASQET